MTILDFSHLTPQQRLDLIGELWLKHGLTAAQSIELLERRYR